MTRCRIVKCPRSFGCGSAALEFRATKSHVCFDSRSKKGNTTLCGYFSAFEYVSSGFRVITPIPVRSFRVRHWHRHCRRGLHGSAKYK
jgi:hypothetical protein